MDIKQLREFLYNKSPKKLNEVSPASVGALSAPADAVEANIDRLIDKLNRAARGDKRVLRAEKYFDDALELVNDILDDLDKRS